MQKNGIIFMLILVLLCPVTWAQIFDELETGQVCSYFGESMPENVTMFQSDHEAEEVLRQIVEASGLIQNFRIRAAGVPNAAAVIKGETRYILYDQYFMQDMKKRTGSSWAAKSIMAHEVGHHLNGHTLSDVGSRPKRELEADYYSGFILQRLGANLDDARVAMLKLGSDSGSRTHPARHDRLAAIGNGWMKACDSDPNCRGVYKSDVFKDCITCPEIVVVPAGSFMMGSLGREEGHDHDEDPQHRVTIEEPFAVGRYEVTRGEYAAFVNATGRTHGNSCFTYEGGEWKDRAGRSWSNPGFTQGEDHPVVCVNWDDARAYVNWMSRKTGKNYRLLSEAEWEYAVRGGTQTRYSWGNGVGRNRANCDGCGSRWDDEMTAPVGSFSANEFGLYDMHGNVFEWTQDCWNDSYTGAPKDGRAWETADCRYRVVRGGSWFNYPRNLRAANRSGLTLGDRVSYGGFRVARTLD